MKEFNQVTKVLKRCWKEKVTITTATVVAFLMGANIYAQENGVYIIPENATLENAVIESNINLSKGIRTNFETSNSQITEKYANKVDLVNKGSIDVNITQEDAKKLYVHGIRVYGNDVNIINDGSIKVTKEKNIDPSGNGPIGVQIGHAPKGKSIFTNNGTIEITDNNLEVQPKNYGSGIFVTSGSKAINNKDIIVKGKGMGVRVDGHFINSNTGKIDISEASYSVGMYVQSSGQALNEGEILLSLNNNNKAIVTNDTGKGVNAGKIILKENASDLKDFNINSIFEGNVVNKGVVEDANGNVIYQSADILIGEDLTLSNLKQMLEYAPDASIAVSEKGSLLKGGSKDVSFTSLNIDGNLVMQNILTSPTNSYGISLSNGTINISNNGKITIGNSNNKNISPDKGQTPTANITLTNVNINGKKDKEKGADIIFDKYDNSEIEHAPSSLTLNNSNVNANIGNSTDLGIVNTLGNTIINGTINVKDFNIGNVTAKAIGEKTNKTTFTSTSKIETGTTVNIAQDGQLALEIGNKGENALNNSTGVTINGNKSPNNGDILLDTSNFSGEGATITLGKNNFNNVTLSSNGIYNASEIKIDSNGVATSVVKFNNLLFEDGKINAINNAAMNANDIFENRDLNVRKQQMEKIYYSNIFAKTVKASYTGVKLVEDKISDLPTTAEVGKWTAMGTGLYNVNKDKEHGFENKIETSGLVASMEYGLNPSTSVGVALSGAYQDVKAATGKADGELMYVGTYAKKEYGPYKLIAGLGYQYGRYKADNTTGYVSSSNKYSTNTFSTYVEGRYTMNVGDAVSFEPKLKLGYTYVDQEDAKDSYIGMSDANLSTFDTEVGADLVKTIAIENGKVDMTFGASYVRAMGDTDKEFTGEFAKSNGTFDIAGANLAKNTGKFDLSVKVTKDSGIFYKGGVTYQVGSDKTRDYGVNIGLGYKF